MPDYTVKVEERHIADYTVTAADPEEAREKAKNSDYHDVMDLEFVEILDENWESWEVVEQ